MWPCFVSLCWQWRSVLRINHSLFIRSSVGGRWGCCHFLAITKNAANVRVQVFCLHGPSPLARMFRSRLAGSYRNRRTSDALPNRFLKRLRHWRAGKPCVTVLVFPLTANCNHRVFFIRSLIFKRQLKIIVSTSSRNFHDWPVGCPCFANCKWHFPPVTSYLSLSRPLRVH